MTNKFLTTDEVAEQLGIHKNTLLLWIKRGQFPPPLRVGGRKHLWLASSLEQFFEQSIPKTEKDFQDAHVD